MGKNDDKTEKPTARRRNKARQEGQVLRSQEVPVAVSLFAAVFTLRIVVPTVADGFQESSRLLFRSAGRAELDGELIGTTVMTMLTSAIVPFLLTGLVAGVAANIAMVGFKITPKAAKPKFSKISPKQGIQKLKPSTAFWEFARVGLKLTALAAVSWGPISEMLSEFALIRGLEQGLGLIISKTLDIFLRVALMMLVIAAADFAVARHKHEKGLKMSKQEIKEERKSYELPAEVRQAQRRKAREFSRNRMLATVGEADVVVTNPTHFAVALKYDEEEGAPKVIAKGTNAFAQKIKREAYRNGVMVIEDKPLARGLYRRVQIGNFIPADLYEAVAVVLATVYRRRARIRAMAAARAAAAGRPAGATA